MSELISRQDFDKFLEDAEKEAVKNRKYVFASALNTIRGNLKIFPSAQPERKKGKWVIHDESANAYECSCCGLAWCLFDGEPKDNNMNYCPKCGADLRE